jgi:hypothetical protein
MSARQIIDTAEAGGIRIVVDGSDLVLEADGDIPGAIVANLKRHKADILSLLRPDRAPRHPRQSLAENFLPAANAPAPKPAPWPEHILKLHSDLPRDECRQPGGKRKLQTLEL